MTIGEARAVNTVVSYLTKSAAAFAVTGAETEDSKTTKRQAREALAVLTERAYDTLLAKTRGTPATRKRQAGATGDDVREGWK